MKWDLEERAEDAIVAYLQQKVSGDMRVYAAWGMDEPQYPCAIVFAGSTEPISEEAEWHDPRQLAVIVAVCTEAAPVLDNSGAELVSARRLNAERRSDVIDALAISGLLAELNGVGIESVAFSMAQLAGSVRRTEERVLITDLSLDVIAEPVEDS